MTWPNFAGAFSDTSSKAVSGESPSCPKKRKRRWFASGLFSFWSPPARSRTVGLKRMPFEGEPLSRYCSLWYRRRVWRIRKNAMATDQFGVDCIAPARAQPAPGLGTGSFRFSLEGTFSFWRLICGDIELRERR